jgi:NADPH:quinone reductase-like Zn-dependent oxidoreductase
MKAITRTAYGGPEVLHLKEIAMPVPKANELLVRVHYTTVNRTDCGILWGKPALIRAFTGLRYPRDLVPGTDFAGVVEKVGAAVTTFSVGQRVWGVNTDGMQSQAEYVAVAQNKAIAQIPDGVTFAQAAASGEGAHYALNYVLSQNMQAGHRVLLNGGTGAIGSAAIQLLKYRGAYVVATAPNQHIAKVKALGADEVIDFENQDFTTLGEQFDFVFDSVGKSEWKKCQPLLKPGGRYISSELGPGAENLYLPFLTLFSARKMKFPIPVNHKRSVAYLTEMLKKGAFNPLIDRIFKPEEIAEAYTYVNSGRKVGNVLVDFS